MTDNYVLNQTAETSDDSKDEMELDPLDLANLDGEAGRYKYKNSELRQITNLDNHHKENKG